MKKIKQLKQGLLLSAALLTMGATVLQVKANNPQSSTNATSQVGQGFPTSPTYENLKKQVEASALSAADKATALKALEANKAVLNQRADLEQKLLDLRQDKLGKVEADYNNLLTRNQDLWTKFYGNDYRRWDEQDDQLGDWDQEDIWELRSGLNLASNLTAAEKEKLLADLDQVEALKADWQTAQADYRQASLSLQQDLAKLDQQLMTAVRQDQSLMTALAALDARGGDWDDRFDLDDWFDGDDRFDHDDNRDDWFD